MSKKRTLPAQKASRQMAISNVCNQPISCLVLLGTQAASQKRKFNCTSHVLLLLCMAFFVGYGWGQTNPSAQTIPLSQNFGTTSFSTLPTEFASWTIGNMTTQANAEASTPTGDASISALTSTTATGGSYGYAASSTAWFYIQSSSNATNGANQLILAINTGANTGINISYTVELVNDPGSSHFQGIELQYRSGTTGAWTNVSGTAVTIQTGYALTTYNASVSGLTTSTAYQLRWITWRPSSGSGSSLGLGITNINLASPVVSYYWNGGTTTALSNTWNNSTSNWNTTGTGSPNVAWPSATGIYNAYFNSAAAASTVIIPSTIAYAPNSITIGTNNYTFATTGSTVGTLAAPIALGNNTLTLAPVSTANLALSSAITGMGGLTINGGGTVVLSGANTYIGTSTITAGTLQLGVTNAIPTGSALVFANTAGASVDLSGFNLTVPSIAGGGSTGGNITNSSTTSNATLTVSNTSGSTSFGGILSDGNSKTLSLTKLGASNLTLSGANTYTGATTLSAGSITLTGSLASAVTVSIGATLLGTGSTSNTTILNGVISPNTTGTAGTLSTTGTGAMAWNNGGSYICDISKIPSSGVAGTDWDKVSVAGSLTTPASGTFSIYLNGTIAGFSNATAYSWVIGTYGSGSPATTYLAINTSGLTNSLQGTFSIVFSSGNINLVYSPTLCAAPANQATSLVLNPVGSLFIPVSFTASTNSPSGYLVIRTSSSTAPNSPTNTTTYTAGTTALGGYIESVGSSISFTSSGLSSSTAYWYWVFGYNNTSCAGGPKYDVTSPLSGTATTATPTLSVDINTFSGFNYSLAAGPSSSQNFNLTAFGLTTASGNITITGSTDFEVSGDNSTFGSTATIAYTSYALSSTHVYIRLKSGLSLATYSSETVTVSGGGASSTNVICSGIVSAAVSIVEIAGWDASLLNNDGPSPFNASTSASNVTIGGLTRGSGVGTGGSPTGSAWGGNTFTSLTAASGVAANAYFTFTATSNVGYTMSLSSINPFYYRRSTTGATTGLVQYQLNSGAFTSIATIYFSSTSNSGAYISSIDLTGISALQNLPPTTVVTFMIVPYGGTSSTGTFYIYDGNTGGNDFSLNGSVSCTVPAQPSTISGTTTVCSGSSQIYSVSSVSNVSYVWSLPSGTTINSGSGTNSVTVTAGSTAGTLSVTPYSTYSGCTTTAGYIISEPISTIATGTWIGTSTFGSTASNWCGGLPSSSTKVVIAAGYTNPIIDGTSSVNNLTIASGTTLTVTGTLQIAGAISNSGTMDASAGTVVFNGASSQTIAANIFANNAIDNLTISNSAGVTLGGTLNLSGTLTPISGVFTTGGYLTLLSTSAGTARIDQVLGTIVGNVTVQRYITAKTARKYIFIGSPISASIRNAWQQQIYISGLGTGGITCGSTTGDAGTTDKYNSNGFDKTVTNSPSMYTYVAAPVNGSRYISVANTESTNLTPGIGYAINIRGNRNSGTVTCANQLNQSNPTSPEAVTLSAKGTVTTGDISIALNNVSIHAYTLLANPYPSQISYTAFHTSNSITNNKMWTFSPSGNGNYTTYSLGTIANGATGYDNTSGDNLASGQAFFVEANTNGNVTFHENLKVTIAIPNNQYFGLSGNKQLRIGLKTITDTLLDEVVLRFNKNGTKDYNPIWDVISFNSSNQVLTTSKGNSKLAISTLLDSSFSDTAYLGVSSNIGGIYRLGFSDFEGIDNSRTITLIDKFLYTNQDIRINPTCNFNVTADTGSQGKNRFEMVFGKYVSTLPINIFNFKAFQNEDKIYLQWKVTDQNNIDSYTVERSLDGVAFTNIASTKAMSTNHFQIEDSHISINAEALFYRIKSTDNNGSVQYSKTISIKLSKVNILMSISPNPVKQILNIILLNSLNHTFSLKVISSEGKILIDKKRVLFTENTLFTPCNNLFTGVYTIVIVDEKGNKQIAKFMKD